MADALAQESRKHECLSLLKTGYESSVINEAMGWPESKAPVPMSRSASAPTGYKGQLGAKIPSSGVITIGADTNVEPVVRSDSSTTATTTTSRRLVSIRSRVPGSLVVDALKRLLSCSEGSQLSRTNNASAALGQSGDTLSCLSLSIVGLEVSAIAERSFQTLDVKVVFHGDPQAIQEIRIAVFLYAAWCSD